ncbi:Plasmodium variant antigen protein Cir/Yir/Bir, putative [Plasmodium berghei]|uniref:Plasmodium variant antigen protein Cir/Yir/Bir, putative n=1 Tax=Plasmodium berghei TaxID=5821 RepID=A0A1D3SAU9_PLABE|nr:Plasmodium variant antigen protein Cir/Yir/Bir, putative [Plasmodium berghei]
MYNELDTSKPTCKKYLENGEEFVKKHEKLNNPNNTKDSAYYKVLYTLSNDYNNFKKYCDNSVDCNDTPLLPEIKTTQNSVQNSELSFEDTSSSSSITNKLIPVLSIIVAIPIFLEIVYKINNKGFINYFRGYLYVIIKKYIIYLPFLY